MKGAGIFLLLLIVVGFLVMATIPYGEAAHIATRAGTPIRINNDTDLKNIATDGDGTPSNPYLIKDLVIDAQGYGYGIYIGNTTKYFLIGDVTIRNVNGNSDSYFWNSGIVIYNATHGKLYNDFVYNGSGYGIFIQSSLDITVDACTLEYNYEGGVYIESSSQIYVKDSYIFNRDTGIGVEIVKSSFISVVHNNINDTYDGIYGNTMTHSIVENNTIRDNNYDGIVLYSSTTGNIIQNNTISYTSNYGIEISNSDFNNVTNNRIENNTRGGIYVNNAAVNITWNHISGNYYGILIYGGKTKIISHNEIFNNSFSGVYLQTNSENNKITD